MWSDFSPPVNLPWRDDEPSEVDAEDKNCATIFMGGGAGVAFTIASRRCDDNENVQGYLCSSCKLYDKVCQMLSWWTKNGVIPSESEIL